MLRASVHVGTDEKPNGGVVIVLLEQVVHSIHVEVELASVFRLERPRLELANYVATKADMIEQQVYLARVVARDEFPLTSQEGKAGSKLQQQISDAPGECILQFPLIVYLVAHGREPEVVVLLEHFLYQLALERRQMFAEVVQDLALVLVEFGFDAVEKCWSAKSFFYRFTDIKQRFIDGFTLGYNINMLSPRH